MAQPGDDDSVDDDYAGERDAGCRDAGGGGTALTHDAGKRVLAIGFEPDTLDFDSDFFRGKPLDAAKIAAGLATATRLATEAGHDFQWLLLDARTPPATAARTTREALAARPVDIVTIGGGIRLNPEVTPMLEALVNAVAEIGGVKLAFNTTPEDAAAAIGRV